MSADHSALRYGANFSADGGQTSHAITVDLVGTGKRVLDVGCASGYLAAALVERGNEVSGVEIDPEAAEVARPHLKQLYVGDIEDADLAAEFGANRFDVVIFADVLEHLRDPERVLRASRHLLSDGGYVVVSIPNVAHGAVRLALLRGRFEYRPLGLLDATHLRFFTRSSFLELVAGGGFAATDVRHTLVDPFMSEIPINRSDYPADLVAEIEADPESYVYQFVARLDPAEASAAPLGAPLAAPSMAMAPAARPGRDGAGEVEELRRSLETIARVAGADGRPPAVGVLDLSGSGDALDALTGGLRSAVVQLELRRRLAGFEVRAFTVGAPPAVSGLGSGVVESLAPWGESSAVDLRAEVDAVVLVGAGDPGVAAELATKGLPVHALPGDVDPILLAGRLAPDDAVNRRREYLALTGRLPADRPYVLCLAADPAGAELEGEVGGRVVVRAEVPPVPEDLLALVAGADSVATADGGVAALAAGLGVPLFAGSPGDDGSDRDGGAAADDAHTAADTAFDDLYRAVLRTAGPPLARSVAQRLHALQRRVAALEGVNAGLREMLARERAVMATEVARREAGLPSDRGRWSSFSIEEMQRDLIRTKTEYTEAKEELDRLNATLTMRALTPARKLYGRIRRRLQRLR